MGKLIDLSNKIFERWKVIKRVENNKHNKPQWLCECSCEKKTQKILSSNILLNGHSKSCGCLKTERYKNNNTYDLSGEYGMGYTQNGEPFYFDLEDYNLIKDYIWSSSNEYIITSVENTSIRMHRLILNILDDDILIDHKNHCKNDNRKENLRTCTDNQNQMNRRISKNNTSGVKGVGWHKLTESWRAYIYINTKYIELGHFDNFNDAVEVRKQAEIEYHKEFLYQGD